jgi:hypothetical protein
MELRTDLERVSLPAKLRHWFFQPLSLFWIFSIIWLNFPLVVLHGAMLAPKYLPKLITGVYPTCCKISSLSCWSTFLEKKIWVFWLLIFWPEASQKRSNQCIIQWVCSIEAYAKRWKSSAKRRWDIWGPDLAIRIGFQ